MEIFRNAHMKISGRSRTGNQHCMAYVNVPAAGESTVDGSSVVCEELAVLVPGWREDDGGEGQVRGVGDLLPQSLDVQLL